MNSLKNHLWTYVSVIAFCTGMSLSAWALSRYMVKTGDTLSEIAERKLGRPLYAKGGSLEKLLSWNPKIQNPNLIRPGEILNLESPVIADMQRGKRAPASILPAEPASVPISKRATRSNPRFGELSLSAGFDFFAISSTDPTNQTSANLLSNMSPEFRFAWRQHWSNRWQSYLGFDLIQASIQDPAPRVLSQSHESSYGFDLGVTHSGSDGLRRDHWRREVSPMVQWQRRDLRYQAWRFNLYR